MKKSILLFTNITFSFIFGFVLYSCCPKGQDLKSEISKEIVFYTTSITTNVRVTNQSTGFERLIDIFKPGTREIVVPVEITVKTALYCDEITNIVIDENKKTVEFKLPDVQFETDGVKINWDEIDYYVDWWRSDFTKGEITDYVGNAIKGNQDFIANHKSEINLDAKKNAEDSLSKFVSSFGYRAIISY